MAIIIKLSESQQRQVMVNGTWVKTSQNIGTRLKNAMPGWLYNFLIRVPGFKTYFQDALRIVENIENGNTTLEKEGINQGIIDQAKQIIGKAKTASNSNLIKEALTIDARVIAAIILIILGIWGAKSLMQDAPTLQGGTQAEQLQQQIGK